MSTYDFSTLITALDTKAQAIAADSSTSAKDLIYLGKAIEAINAVSGGGLDPANNLSDLTNAATARLNLGFDGTGITNGQLMIWNAALQKFQAGTISSAIVSQSNPDGTETGVELGDLYVNSASGEIWICHAVTPVVAWLGTLGGSVNIPQGQAIFFQPRTSSQNSNYYTGTWTVPAGVTKFSAVCVGGGGGGGYNWASSAGMGGGLAWANDIPVTPGDSISISVGNGGWQSSHGYASSILKNGTNIFGAYGGQHGGTSQSGSYGCPFPGQITTDGTTHTITPGNINSGRGGLCSQNGYGGGGGAGGYTGNGGNGSYGNTNNSNGNGGPNGTGGGGGGGGGYDSSTYAFAGGGGVGLFGEGTSGTGKQLNDGNSFYSDGRYIGRGGSGGEDGSDNNNSSMSNRGKLGNTADSDADMNTGTGSGPGTGSRTTFHAQGGMFGGGGGGGGTSVSSNQYFNAGGPGGVRIIWGGGRAFPATNTGNVTEFNLP